MLYTTLYQKKLKEALGDTEDILEQFAMEENVLLKEMLARHKGENPVVIDFEAPDEFDNNKRFQLLTNNHLYQNNLNHQLRTIRLQ